MTQTIPEDDLDQENPIDLEQGEWAEFYGDVERRTGMDIEEYLDHDHGMDR